MVGNDIKNTKYAEDVFEKMSQVISCVSAEQIPDLEKKINI